MPFKIFGLLLIASLVMFVVHSSATASIESKPKVPDYERNQVKNTLLKDVVNPLQDCFKKWSASNPGFTFGKLQMDWEIQPRGSVKSVRVIHSDLKDINSCAERLVKRARFPHPPEGKPYFVTHTFVFKNEK